MVYRYSRRNCRYSPQIFRRKAHVVSAPSPLPQGVRRVTEPILVRTEQEAATYLLSHIFHPLTTFWQEEFIVLLLNHKRGVTHYVNLYRGTQSAVTIRVAEVFREAIRYRSSAILVAHNHPSGDLTPSLEDLRVTTVLEQAGALLDVPLLDHIIISTNGWMSLRTYRNTTYNG